MTVSDVAKFLFDNKITDKCLIAPSGKRATCDLFEIDFVSKKPKQQCQIWLDELKKPELWCSTLKTVDV